MVDIIQDLVSPYRYGLKCPHEMTAASITVHNTANDAAARAEVSYMRTNAMQTSFHVAVDDKEAVQGIPYNRNAWHAGDGNGPGNMTSIAVEICYSKSGGPRFERAERNAAELIAHMLTERGWGIDKVKKHQDWSGKYCPHRTLDMGWKRFLDMVSSYMQTSAPVQPTVKVSEPEYRVYTAEDKWLAPVKGLADYAGWKNHRILGIAIRVPGKAVKYRVHTVKGRWLPYVTGYDIADYNNGYAGDIRNAIDAIEIICDGAVIKYRVCACNYDLYFDWQHNDQKGNGQDGYAGVFGRPICKLQATIE